MKPKSTNSMDLLVLILIINVQNLINKQYIQNEGHEI